MEIKDKEQSGKLNSLLPVLLTDSFQSPNKQSCKGVK